MWNTNRVRWRGLTVGLVIGSMVWTTNPVRGQCAGDCDGDGAVTVNELISAVRISLGDSPLEDCAAADRNGDGAVTVDELIAAVNAALNGCSEPTPTPTPVESCPLDFSDDFENEPFVCGFRGRWNDECGDADLEVTFAVLDVDGERIAGAIIADEPLRLFAALPLNVRQALIVAHGLLEDPDSLVQIGGSMELSEDGRMFTVAPSRAVFDDELSERFRDCPLERFVGEFSGLVAAE